MAFTQQKLHQLLFLVLAATLLYPASAADPYQCQDLRNIIPACNCESKMVNNVEDPTKVVLACNNIQLSSVPPINGRSDYIVYEMTLANNNIQSIPAKAFDGLRIQRLDLTGNRLTTIDTGAFQGLENDLQELYIGAEKSASVSPPLASFTNLSTLHTLHLEYFKFPLNVIQQNGQNLLSLSGLRSLTLKNNELLAIESGTLPTSLTSLTLDHQNLSSMPVDILTSLRQLQYVAITHTIIAVLYNHAFQFNDQLKEVDMSFNRINSIELDAFDGIANTLQKLSLRNNPLGDVTKLNELKELPALTSLQLSDIGLSSLPAGAMFLQNKATLVSLHLEGNPLTTVGPNTFTPLGTTSSLKELNLARQQLSSIDTQAFSGLTALTSLDLGHQNSNTALVLPVSLSQLPALDTLKLSSTWVNTNSLWDRIGSLTSLVRLHIDGTKLATVREFALQNLTQLQELNLDNNQLTQLTQRMLAGPHQLTRLMANNNQITSISNCAFYEYTLAPALTLDLLSNPLNCDCKLDWLLREKEAGRITPTGMCDAPANKQGTLLSLYSSGDFTCVSPQPEESCSELFTTAKPPQVTTIPTASLTITNVSTTTISLQWSIPDFPTLDSFKVRIMNLETSNIKHSGELHKSTRNFVATGLKSGMAYSLCLLTFDNTSAFTLACKDTTTLSSGSGADSQDQNQDSGSSDVGIIVGVVVGVLVLLALIAAILYITLLRKRSTAKKEGPVQPHTFTASELPGMSSNTKQFTRPREKQKPKVGRALDENIKVTVISDGNAAPVSPRDRQSVGSYQFLDEKHPNPNPGMAPQRGSSHSDDLGARALPSAPQDSMKGYYNHSFQRDSDIPPHAYNQIEH